MQLNIPITKESRSKAILKLLNPFLGNLTDTELNIVSTMVDMEIVSVTRSNRANLRTKVKMGKFCFNNYIQNLKKKGVILQTTDDLILNPKIQTIASDSSFTINFIQSN